jgi:primosomal protein N'
MTFLRLQDARLCPNCDAVSDEPDVCPACGHSHGMLGLATILNRTQDAPSRAPEARGASDGPADGE